MSETVILLIAVVGCTVAFCAAVGFALYIHSRHKVIVDRAANILKKAEDKQQETNQLYQTIVDKHNQQSKALAELDNKLTNDIEKLNNQLATLGLSQQIRSNSPFAPGSTRGRS